MKNIKHILSLAVAIGFAAAAEAQGIVSPEINADGTVTFRYPAPRATKVQLSGQFLSGNLDMTRDAEGVWSVTTPPVTPDIYPYNFVVDGITANDPNNPFLFPNERFKGNLLDMPSTPPLIHSQQDVPHGRVSYRWYHSEQLDLERPLVIYTPPGYDPQGEAKYPVLYLIHGMTDTHETWFKVGRVNDILDNLIAQGRAKPMIVVMPYANAAPALMARNGTAPGDVLGTDLFTRELIREIVPWTERNYRAEGSVAGRAVAGFSLGGRQTLAAGLGHPEVFSHVCAFAPAIWGEGMAESFDRDYAPAAQLRNLKLLWISCGVDDGLYAGSQALEGVLKSKRIRYQTLYTPGGHTWMNCRIYLTEISQRLFK
ncbi:MAG: esterase [Alistipes sp.]|jgi:enterochelin esterase family protein|nr:esterase [Alistipes sp.]